MHSYTIVDLTQEVHAEIPTWDLTCGYFIKTMRDYHHCEGDFKFRSQSFDIRASAGTHMDAPSHCYEGGLNVNEIPLENLIAPCIVIDISHQKDPHYKATLQDVQEFEKKHGTINPKSFVIFYTGWSRFWNEPKKYHNNLIFPSISADAAKLLVERDVVGIGIDTLSPDCDEKGSFVHAIVLGAGKFIVENVAHADKLPATGSTILIMPLNIQGAAESPIRLIGLIDKKENKMQAESSSSSSREISVGKIYKHYSGKTYKVIGIAHDSENPSLMRVIYQGLYDCATFGPNPVWDRPYPMFAEMVTINGKEQYRFEEVSD